MRNWSLEVEGDLQFLSRMVRYWSLSYTLDLGSQGLTLNDPVLWTLIPFTVYPPTLT